MPVGRLELPAHRLKVGCSTTELHQHKHSIACAVNGRQSIGDRVYHYNTGASLKLTSLPERVFTRVIAAFVKIDMTTFLYIIVCV